MIRAIKRPRHPDGLWHWVTRFRDRVTGGKEPEFLQKTHEMQAFGGCQHGDRRFHVLRMPAKSTLDQAPTFICEFHEPGATVFLISSPANQLPGFEAVDRSRDGSAGQQNHFSDHIYQLRTFVEEHLKHRKVG
jgi:hypothetical protein